MATCPVCARASSDDLGRFGCCESCESLIGGFDTIGMPTAQPVAVEAKPASESFLPIQFSEPALEDPYTLNMNRLPLWAAVTQRKPAKPPGASPFEHDWAPPSSPEPEPSVSVTKSPG